MYCDNIGTAMTVAYVSAIKLATITGAYLVGVRVVQMWLVDHCFSLSFFYFSPYCMSFDLWLLITVLVSLNIS
jgi:hypothetical protein